MISQPNDFDGPVSVRLMIHARLCSRVEAPDGLFRSDGKTRLFRRGGDYLLAFQSGTGTTNLTNFVRITASPPRAISETAAKGYPFQYAPLHHFQSDGRFDEHLRHWDDSPGLYTRHWMWSNRRHKFIVTGASRLHHWDGWDDESLR